MEIILLSINTLLLLSVIYMVYKMYIRLCRPYTEPFEPIKDDDEDYASAKDFVVTTSKASTSSLQTAFRWGYNKTARIMSKLEEDEVIGPAKQGERYRKILFKK